jgi:hypothetical protein
MNNHDVSPQPSQTKHDPAILIFTPHVIQSGASDFDPLIFSKRVSIQKIQAPANILQPVPFQS